MIIAIDFDGTIAQHDYPNVGPEVPGAFAWMRRFQAAGARLILWTMRSPVVGLDNIDPLAAAVDFCRERGVEFWGVNQNPEQRAWTSSPKVYAHTYVDDAAFGCPMVSTGLRPYVDWSVVGPAVLDAIVTFNR